MNANIYRTQTDLLRCIRPSGLLPRLDTRLRADSICPQGCWGGGSCTQVLQCGGTASPAVPELPQQAPRSMGRAGKTLFPSMSWEDVLEWKCPGHLSFHTSGGSSRGHTPPVGCRQLQVGASPAPLTLKVVSSDIKQKGW